MSSTTKIEWADGTFNPWIGCTKVSPGCAHCYAEQTTRARVLRSQGHETWGKGAKRSRTSAAMWKEPIRWNKEARIQESEAAAEEYDIGGHNYHRPRIFPSLCDWLDEEVPVEWLADFLRLIFETPNLDWLLLTKRPGNFSSRMQEVMRLAEDKPEHDRGLWAWALDWATGEKIPQNIWIGTSVEDQVRVEERIPELLKIPAKVRFLSVEPLLGSCELRMVSSEWGSKIDWVIVGGESGPKARPCNVEWVRSIVQQCQAAGVACFVKQLGENVISRNDAGFEGESKSEWPMDTHWAELDPQEYQGAPVRILLDDRKGGNMAEWPEDLRVREFPVLTQRRKGAEARRS